MKHIIIILFCCIFGFGSFAQTTPQKPVGKVSLYNPKANAQEDINAAVRKAKANNKHVLVQIGGDWCIWCKRLNAFITNNDILNSTLHTDYEVVHVNYSPENKNLELLSKWHNPHRLGFPVIVILDENGQYLHTQNTGLLEKGNGYDESKLADFFKNWSYQSIHSTTNK